MVLLAGPPADSAADAGFGCGVRLRHARIEEGAHAGQALRPTSDFLERVQLWLVLKCMRDGENLRMRR